MEELRELYQEVILDHNKSPRNFQKLENTTHSATGDNPLCGDHIDLYLYINDQKIENISFTGKGCAISKASASVMTDELRGKTLEEAKVLFDKFHNMITAEMDETPDYDGLGKLAVFAGVKEFPVRVKCASLSWHTFNAALENTHSVTTE